MAFVDNRFAFAVHFLSASVFVRIGFVGDLDYGNTRPNKCIILWRSHFEVFVGIWTGLLAGFRIGL